MNANANAIWQRLLHVTPTQVRLCSISHSPQGMQLSLVSISLKNVTFCRRLFD